MPQFLTEDERKLLTEGMEISIDKIGYEVLKSSKLTEKTGPIHMAQWVMSKYGAIFLRNFSRGFYVAVAHALEQR